VNRYGGRVVAFSLNQRNALLSAGVQTGSTFWPSPQALWQWPPPKLLDEGRYQISQLNEQTIQLRSQIEPSLGIRVVKTFQVANSGVVIHYSVINESDEIVTVAPWEISRVNGGLTLYSAQTEPESRSTCAVEYAYKHYWYEYHADRLQGIPKVFANNTDGWLANVNNGLLFLKKFPCVDSNLIAPAEAEVEIYAHADAMNPYVEIEQQGEFKAILPGRDTHWAVEWLLYAVPPSVKVAVGSLSLLDFIAQIIDDAVPEAAVS